MNRLSQYPDWHAKAILRAGVPPTGYPRPGDLSIQHALLRCECHKARATIRARNLATFRQQAIQA